MRCWTTSESVTFVKYDYKRRRSKKKKQPSWVAVLFKMGMMENIFTWCWTRLHIWNVREIVVSRNKVGVNVRSSVSERHTNGRTQPPLIQLWKARSRTFSTPRWVYWPLQERSMSTASQHNALHITGEHLVVLDLTQLPVELPLFLGPPAVGAFSQCNTLYTGQVGQHVIWQGHHTGARQVQLLQWVQSAEDRRAQILELGVVWEIQNLQALQALEAVWLDFLKLGEATDV